MSYFVDDDQTREQSPHQLIYFGQSKVADHWIERNLGAPRRTSAPQVRLSSATVLADGVTRYEGEERGFDA